MIRPGIVITKRHVPGVLFLAWPMAEPVVNHELDPCGRQEVEEGYRFEGVASQQFKADGTRVRPEDFCVIIGVGILQWNVAPKTRIGTAHSGNVQVIEGSISRACREVVPATSFRRGRGWVRGLHSIGT